jgi:hypothetical protein
MISLFALSMAFFALTLLIIIVLVVVLRQRLAGGPSETQGGPAPERVTPPAAKEEA